MSQLSPSSLAPALELLTSRAGKYQGTGTNFEGHSFTAQMELAPKVAGALVELSFRATENADGDDVAGFHEELTWITSDLKTDHLCLWTVSSNTPGVLCHPLIEDRSDDFRDRRFVFRLGDTQARATFRQEIVLDLMRDGTVEYRYSWGVPHEDLAVRVQAKLRKI